MRARRARFAPWRTRPTAHGARARWRTWRGCLRGQRATRSTPRRWPRLFFTDTAPGRRLRLRSVVTTAFGSRGARPARASPRGKPADRPRSTRALADLACCLRGQRATRSTSRRWPRLFFTDTAPGRRLRLRNVVPPRSTAVSRDPRALRPVENRPTAHGARARWRTWRGCLRGQRATRSTPTPLAEALLHRHRARSAAAASNAVITAFIPWRAARARFAPWRTGRPPTEHARAGGLGVVVFAANARRAPSHAVGRGSSSPTPRQVGGCGFETSCLRVRLPCRAARARFAPWRTGRPPTEHARAGGLGVVVFAANARHAPPHAVGRGSSSPTPRQVGGCGFETCNHSIQLPCRATRARFAPWRTSRPPTEHARAGGLGVVVFAANARRAPSHAVGQGSSPPTPRQVDGCGFGTRCHCVRLPCRAARVRFAPWRTSRRPRSTRALADLACCLRGQRATRSIPRRWPRLFFTDTVPGRRLRLRNVVTTASELRVARPARASPRGEPADRPRSTSALADLAWLSSRPTRDALHPTPLAEALLHRHRARSAAAASRLSDHCFRPRAARPARASLRGEPADRPRSTRALADLAWLSSRPTRDALHPTPLAEALLHRHRARSAAAASKRRCPTFDYRVARPARAAPRGEPADRPREHARAGGLGVVVFAANARRAPPHAVGRGSSSPTPRQVDGCGFGTP